MRVAVVGMLFVRRRFRVGGVGGEMWMWGWRGLIRVVKRIGDEEAGGEGVLWAAETPDFIFFRMWRGLCRAEGLRR